MPAQPKRTRAPRGTLSAERILQAAIRILDAESLEALTMARLAAELDVKPMSLYTHYRDKDAILTAVSAELYERIVIPPRETPDLAHLRRIMIAYFQVLADNPVLMKLDRPWEGITEPEARVYDELWACLEHIGVAPHAAVKLVATLLRYTVGAAYLYRARQHWDEDSEYWTRYRSSLGALSPETFPAAHWVWSSRFAGATQQETYEFGLDVLISAIEAYPSTHPDEDEPERLDVADASS